MATTAMLHDPPHAKLTAVVIFFELLLVLASVLITWFGLYAVYRLVKDES